MHISFQPIVDNARWAYNNPRKTALYAGQTLVSLVIGYVAFQQGRALYGQEMPIRCNCLSTSTNLVDFSTKLVATAALCLASVVTFKYKSSRGLPPIPK